MCHPKWLIINNTQFELNTHTHIHLPFNRCQMKNEDRIKVTVGEERSFFPASRKKRRFFGKWSGSWPEKRFLSLCRPLIKADRVFSVEFHRRRIKEVLENLGPEQVLVPKPGTPSVAQSEVLFQLT